MNTKDYSRYRARYSELVYELIEHYSFPRKDMITVSRKFDFWDGEKMVFDHEDEMNYIFDYYIFEIIVNQKLKVDEYLNLYPKNYEEDFILLNAFKNHFSSFFLTKEIDRSTSQILLKDILTNEEKILMDLSMTQTIDTGTLIYSRLVPFEDIHMTTGVSFPYIPAFNMKIINTILKKKSVPTAIRRKNKKMTFLEKGFYLHQKYGIPIQFNSMK